MSGTLHVCFVGPAASITFQRWVNWFVTRGHEVTVLTVEPAEAPGFRQVDLSTAGWPRKLGRIASALQMPRLVRQLKPDILHVHYARGLAWGLVAYGPDPAVVTPWGSDVLEEQGAFREPYAKPLTRRLLRQARLVTAHSQFMETRVRRLVPDLKRLERIGWGVDLRLFREGGDLKPIKQRWDIGEDRLVIFSPRLAQPFYRHDHVIEAMPAIREKVPGALLVISEMNSDPNYLARLRQLVARLDLDQHVRFVGTISYGDMPLWFNLAKAVVMIPQSDGMPNSLLEAMACGAVPVLARLPQYAELVRHGENGFFVDPDGGDLAGPLIGVLSDRALQGHIAARNRKKILELGDQDREMSRLEHEYRQLAGKRV